MFKEGDRVRIKKDCTNCKEGLFLPRQLGTRKQKYYGVKTLMDVLGNLKLF